MNGRPIVLAALVVTMVPACDAGGNTISGSSGCPSAGSDAGDAFVKASPQEVAIALGRGINFGNMFDAPHEGDWNIRYDPSYVGLVKQAGFTHVRLPVRWSNHAAVTEDANLDEAFACRIDGVIDLAVEAGLYVVMDVHHYRQLDGDPLDPGETAVDEAVVDARLVSVWKQLAARYRTRSNHLVFEIYNEPHNRLTPDHWNTLAAEALATIRESAPDRIVMMGGTDWYNFDGLASLQVPADPQLMLTLHDYDPYQFTFQGSYVMGSDQWLGTTCCDPDQQQLISSGLDAAASFAKDAGLPMYLGEFGSSVAADEASRLAYARYVRDQAEARGMPWAVWSLVDNGIYDPSTRAWREDLKAALVGP